MTTFSFCVLPKKSVLIEKNRFNNHRFVKQEGKFYIYARQQVFGSIEGGKIHNDYWSFIQSIAIETESVIYILLKELGNRESENDISIDKYINAKGDLDSKKAVEITQETSLQHNLWYKYSFDM